VLLNRTRSDEHPLDCANNGTEPRAESDARTARDHGDSHAIDHRGAATDHGAVADHVLDHRD